MPTRASKRSSKKLYDNEDSSSNSVNLNAAGNNHNGYGNSDNSSDGKKDDDDSGDSYKPTKKTNGKVDSFYPGRSKKKVRIQNEQNKYLVNKMYEYFQKGKKKSEKKRKKSYKKPKAKKRYVDILYFHVGLVLILYFVFIESASMKRPTMAPHPTLACQWLQQMLTEDTKAMVRFNCAIIQIPIRTTIGRWDR